MPVVKNSVRGHYRFFAINKGTMITAGISTTGPDKIAVSVARNSVRDHYSFYMLFLHSISVAIIAETSIVLVCEGKRILVKVSLRIHLYLRHSIVFTDYIFIFTAGAIMMAAKRSQNQGCFM